MYSSHTNQLHGIQFQFLSWSQKFANAVGQPEYYTSGNSLGEDTTGEEIMEAALRQQRLADKEE